jgi:hypothetical protein
MEVTMLWLLKSPVSAKITAFTRILMHSSHSRGDESERGGREKERGKMLL